MKAVGALTVVAMAVTLSACGGGGSSTATRGGSQEGAGATTPTPEAPANAAGAANEGSGQGRPSSRSAGFRAAARKGGLPHLPESGSEASAAQRGQAQAALASYLSAVRAGKWARACRYLSPYYIVTLRSTGAAAGGCGNLLRLLYRISQQRSSAPFPTSAPPRVESFRVEPSRADQVGGSGVEESGFALMRAPGGAAYWASLNREGGAWKLTVITPQPLG